VILTYPQAQGIIQTSWNWPAGRKDMEIYGQTGYVVAVDDRTMRLRMRADRREKTLRLPPALPGLRPVQLSGRRGALRGKS